MNSAVWIWLVVRKRFFFLSSFVLRRRSRMCGCTLQSG